MFHVADFQDVYTQKFFMRFLMTLFEMGTDKIYVHTYGHDATRKSGKGKGKVTPLQARCGPEGG